MSQLLKKCALLAVCAALALCFTTRSAHAQAVADKGVGEHLLFAYWTTANYTDTLVAVHSPVGVRSDTAMESMNVVRVVVRDEMGMSQADFRICLTPGDSWTAALSMAGLMVKDAGGCDEMVAPPAASTNRDGSGGMMATPMPGEMVALGADGGYLEAWVAPVGGLADDTIPCTLAAGQTDAAPLGILTATEAGRAACADKPIGDPDNDRLPENATPMDISGIATLVSPMAGFSSSYNPTALMNCGNIGTADTDARSIATALPAATNGGDDGNGCWHIRVTDGENTDTAGAPITTALVAQEKDLLVGRWTAINDDKIMSHTKVVLTFPVNHLNYEGKDRNGGDVMGTDPVSLIAFDDMGTIVARGSAMLGMNANMCRFSMMGDDHDSHDDHADDDHADDDHADDDHADDVMGDDVMGDDMMMGMVSCNGEMVDEFGEGGRAGYFRIFNNTMDAQVAATTAPTLTDGIPTNEPGYVTSDGAERDDLGIRNALDVTPDTDDMAAGGQVPAEPLAAIGINFSYFEGTDDGVLYDQVTPLQWASTAAPVADTVATTRTNVGGL